MMRKSQKFSDRQQVLKPSAKRIDPLAATSLVSSNPLGSSGRNIIAPAPQGPGLSRHDPSVKAIDLSGISERSS